jgi:hypothetical protein
MHPYVVACLLWSACWALWIVGALDDDRPLVIGVVLAAASALGIALLWAYDGEAAARPSPIWLVAVDLMHGAGAAIGGVLLVRRRRALRALATASRRRRRRWSGR